MLKRVDISSWLNAILIYVSLSIISLCGTHFILLIMGILIFFSLTMIDKPKLGWIVSYILLLIIGTFTTVNAIVYEKVEFSWYQFFRSGIFTIIFPLMFFVDVRKLFYRHSALISHLCLIVGFGVLIDAIFQTNFSPSYIRAAGGHRVYSVLFPVAPFLMLIGLRYFNPLLLIGSIMTLIASGGKIGIFLIFVAIMLRVLENGNFLKFAFRKKHIYYSILVIIVMVASINRISERAFSFIVAGDASRFGQSMQVMTSLEDSKASLFFGLGHATKIIQGNYYYSSEVSDKLYVNSQYDVEVGYFHLMARFGIVGICILLYILFKSPVRFAYFFWFFIIPFMGMSFSGIAPVSGLVGLSLLRSDTKKYD